MTNSNAKKGTILLTGGTGKLGRVMFDYFTNHNWSVVITSRKHENLNLLLDNQTTTNYGFVVDLLQQDSIPMLMKLLKENNIVITHLINNARSLESLAVADNGFTKRSVFLDEFELDVIVPYELTMTLAQSEDHSLQTVVNIGSQYGIVAPNPSLYSGNLDNSPIQYGVSKAALHHLTREMAVRLLSHNIRVNCVAFGGFEGRVDSQFLSRYKELTPARRMLNDSEVIGPVEFLLSEASSAVNGHLLVADGGWSIW